MSDTPRTDEATFKVRSEHVGTLVTSVADMGRLERALARYEMAEKELPEEPSLNIYSEDGPRAWLEYSDKLRAQFAKMTAERDELKHDIARHVQIATDLATERAEKAINDSVVWQTEWTNISVVAKELKERAEAAERRAKDIKPRVGLPLLYNIVCLHRVHPKDEAWFADMAELMRLADKLLYEEGYEVSPYAVNQCQIEADSKERQ